MTNLQRAKARLAEQGLTGCAEGLLPTVNHTCDARCEIDEARFDKLVELDVGAGLFRPTARWYKGTSYGLKHVVEAAFRDPATAARRNDMLAAGLTHMYLTNGEFVHWAALKEYRLKKESEDSQNALIKLACVKSGVPPSAVRRPTVKRARPSSLSGRCATL